MIAEALKKGWMGEEAGVFPTEIKIVVVFHISMCS